MPMSPSPLPNSSSGQGNQSVSRSAPSFQRKLPRTFRIILLISAITLGVTLVSFLASIVFTVSFSLLEKHHTLSYQLNNAAMNLTHTFAIRYTGQIIQTDGTKSQIDLMITTSGTTRGTITEGATIVQMLTMDGKTFLQADQDFWRKNGMDARKASLINSHWVMTDPHELGAIGNGVLTPANLGSAFAQMSASLQLSDGPISQVNGVSARPISTPQGIVYVTTATPYHIVRIIFSKASINSSSNAALIGYGLGGSNQQRQMYPLLLSEGSHRLQGGSSDEIDLSLYEVSNDEIQNLYAQLTTNIEQLRNAIDSEVQLSMAGSHVQLQPCNTSSCTAEVILANQMSTTKPSIKLDQPLTVEVYIYMTMDGRIIHDCVYEVTMLPNSSVSKPLLCTAVYALPEDGKQHYIQAKVEAVVKAMVSVDILHMAADLLQQMLPWRLRSAGPYGLPGWSKTDGPYRFVPPETYNPKAGPLKPGNDGFVDKDGAIWKTGPMHNQSYKNQGIYYEWDVQLTKAQAASPKWRDVVTCGKSNLRPNQPGYCHANISPDGYDTRTHQFSS